MAKESMRRPAYAGSFYPAEKSQLGAQVSAFLSFPAAKAPKNLRAIIAPHAGYVYSGPTAGKAYGLLSQLAPQPKNIVLLGPSHNALFSGLASCSAREWQTPLGSVKSASIDVLCGKSGLVLDACQAHAPEHCLEVQLPFLQSVMKGGYAVYPALTCETDAAAAADYLAPELRKPESFLVVSSDLSHYLPLLEANEADARTGRIISSIDVSSANGIDACGKTGIVVAMILARKLGWKCVQLAHSTSAQASGDDSRVVGYGAFAFHK
jgi:AmmeMemoRadiSam system protein B